MEKGEEFFLQFPSHVDEEIAAEDAVEFGKRRVFDHVLLGKNQHVADAFVDAIRTAVGLGRKKAGQPFRRDIGRDAGRIQPASGRGDGLAIDVGGKNLHHETLLGRLQKLLQEDGDGIGFPSGGAAR